jgi:hypothetical protein
VHAQDTSVPYLCSGPNISNSLAFLWAVPLNVKAVLVSVQHLKLRYILLFVRLFECNNWVPTERVLVKFCVGDL